MTNEARVCSCSQPPRHDEYHSVPCDLFGTDHPPVEGRTPSSEPFVTPCHCGVGKDVPWGDHDWNCPWFITEGKTPASGHSLSSESHPDRYVIDQTGLVWALVHDGGMATRAHYGGIVSMGINALEQEAGPLTPFSPRKYRDYLLDHSPCVKHLGCVGHLTCAYPEDDYA